MPAGTVTYDASTGGSLTFTGTAAQYDALQLTFPTDYSTESPGADGLVLTGTLSATSTEDATGQTAPVTLRITPEGDLFIDDSLPDTVPDETDGPTLLTPSELLFPEITDADGSESFTRMVLVVEGLPPDATPVFGPDVTLSTTVAADGSVTATFTVDPAAPDMVPAYQSIQITLAGDFSTANRSDLSNGDTQLPLTFRLTAESDEDRDLASDLPDDGQATVSRVVDIGFEEDIDLAAPDTITAAEDDGVEDSDQGVTVDLGIEITVDDADGSETEDPTSIFGAQVRIYFGGLPTGAAVNGGTLVGPLWTGSVTETEALTLALPGNYNGTVTGVILVTTREGFEVTPQEIVITPTPDGTIIAQSIDEQETDAPVTIRFSDYLEILDTDPGELVESGSLTVTGLPPGTTSNGGTITADGTGTFTLTYVYPQDFPPPQDLTVTFPADYSTDNPGDVITGDLSVEIRDGTDVYTEDLTFPIHIAVEGDVEVDGADLVLDETDDLVLFRPVDSVLPQATDADGSESIQQIGVVLPQAPEGMRYSLDGVSFMDLPANGILSLSEAEYGNLVFELPADFSTQSPQSNLNIFVLAATDENGGAIGRLSVEVRAEGDIVMDGPGAIVLGENDAPNDSDEDATSSAPMIFALRDAVDPVATDVDGSESVASIDVTLAGLPDGAFYSTDDGQSWIAVPTGGTLSLTGLTEQVFDRVQVRLPDDFSTVDDLIGSVTARTDESILAGETDSGPDDGVETREFIVTISSEADVRIDVADITVIEDLGEVIPLDIAATVTDIDGSETITDITVAFDGLPTNGPTTLTEGTQLTGPQAVWSGTAAQLTALGVASFPEHFSGVIDISVTVITDEGDPAGTSDAFVLNVTPVAEPAITLSVDDNEAAVTGAEADQFVVKEDAGFLLLIDAQTPDRDGSESLTQIVIENLPAGWVASTGGAVDLALFEAGAADVAGATISGTTLTITLLPGVTAFDGALRVTPLADDDRDVETLMGGDLVATVTSVDTATGLPSDTATAGDGTDVDVDAVVDGATPAGTDETVNENRADVLVMDLGLGGIALEDSDGSEVFSAVELTFTIATASSNFDPLTDLLLSGDPAVASFVAASAVSSTADSVTYRFEPGNGATTQEFSDALATAQIILPRYFSGVITVDGTADWQETTTPVTSPGDVELDQSDNFNSATFQFVKTVSPQGQADLTASVFVLDTDDANGDPTRVEATVRNGSIAGAEILTLLEATADGSSPGGATAFFVGMSGYTPDKDGSEQMVAITVRNVPTEWIAPFVSNGVVDRAAFHTLDGSGPISDAEWAKVDQATYDETTGELVLELVPGVTEFEGAVLLQPTLYEDYDVDRQDGDDYSAAGAFFGDDLHVVLDLTDTNTATTQTRSADAELDVDVDPVNNFAIIQAIPVGNEQVIDDANGVWNISLDVRIPDTDGSEQITALVLRQVPAEVTVYVTDPNDPTGPKIPALITELNSPPGFNSWSLENGEWLDIEFRGIPTHTAGNVALDVDVVTTEDDGTTRVTPLNQPLYIQPVADGGDPSESAATLEDTAVQVSIDGNIIDNMTNSPGSPEAILNYIILENVQPDSAGRQPTFYDGDPAQGGMQITFSAGQVLLTPEQAANLWVLPGQDSNETVQFDVRVLYYETILPSETLVATGTVTVDVTGVADTPVQVLQNEDPSTTAGGIALADVDAIYRPSEVIDGLENYNRLYGYAGYDTAPFVLNMRLTDEVLRTGFTDDPAQDFEAADPPGGTMTEIVTRPPDGFDGSETLYHVITGVDPRVDLLGAQSIDATGETYLVTSAKLSALSFVPTNVSEITYYDMTMHTIVLEDDQEIILPPGNSVEDNLAYLDSLTGGAVVSEDFSVVVLPQTGTGPDPCPPEKDLPLPELMLIGGGDEDTEIALKLKITPVPGFYDSIGDLAVLPNGVNGDFTLAIDLPPGATLSSDPSGAVLPDPTSGRWVIDIAKLGVDPSDPTQTEGSILFTPPPHQSSPVNPFDPDETLGPDDPYDDLSELDYAMRLVNVDCDTVKSGSGTFDLTINPVVDGPDIILGGADVFDEDTVYDLGLSIEGIDGGERLVGDVEIVIGGGDPGIQLIGPDGPLTGTVDQDGVTTYLVDPDDIGSLSLVPTEHLAVLTSIRVSATSEDIDGSQLTNTVQKILQVIPVADVPVFDFDTSTTDPDTGLPYVDDSGSDPVITIVEDQAFTLADVLDVYTPDQDGSETLSITIFDVPSYLRISGPSGSGFIDNGDGSYTISAGAYQQVTLQLRDEHARTPDALDPSLPDAIPLRISASTLELGNSDTAASSQTFSIRVRPDADVPVLTASIDPATGVEDQPQPYAITLSATTPDPHEAISFQVSVPATGSIYLDGNVLTPDANGMVTIAGVQSGGSGPFTPAGAVTFVPVEDFGGQVALNAVAITSDAELNGSFVDTQASAVVPLELDVTVSPDLVVTVDDPDVELQETDDAVSFAPAGDFTIDVADVDGSEVVTQLTYTISGVPDGTTYSVGGGTPVAASGDLVFTGTQAEFDTLTVTFPADFATNDTPLNGTLNVQTNENGNETGAFTIDVAGELDLVVTNTTPIALAQDGAPLVVEFGIDADVTDQQAVQSEWLEEVVITFDTPLPAGTTASAGVIDANRQTLTYTRGTTDIATFAAAVAALSITLPGTAAAGFGGEITVSTNHGTAPAQAFVVDLNDQPQISGPVSFSTTETSFDIDFATLLANATDSDNLTVENPSSDDPDVSVTLLADAVRVTVPDGYVGNPVLTYDVVDDAGVPATAQATADLNINTMQMIETGQVMLGNPLLSDVTGAPGGNDIALGTDAADSVVLDPSARPYAEVEGFSLLGGDDIVDLSAGSAGYSVDGGAGADRITGSAGDDLLSGGADADTLTGGAGDDIFAMTDLLASDVITDYRSPSAAGETDQLDLSSLVQLSGTEAIADRVSYDTGTGALNVDGSQVAEVQTGSGFANQVQVIFEDAANTQQSAVI
ncbi:hypothetical protein [Marinibacterium profundimaris]|uniref:hypothetical protein n=1 Tax=Marinibacterium profundimaris TaxID=1679460 RepID=UPI001E532EA7|nr:hypothetical protein [Marinibacterium profundimaris]